MTTGTKQIVVGLLILFQVAAVLILAKWMKPIADGNAVDFWRAACGVNLDGNEKERMLGIYQPRDGWHIYYIQGFHGQSLFRVASSEVNAKYPAVVEKVRSIPNTTNIAPILRWAATALEQTDRSTNHSPENFLEHLREEHLKAYKNKSEGLYQYVLNGEEEFSKRWERIQRFWVNIIFECFFFAGLSLFAFWPWLRMKGDLAWRIHLGLIPLLLFLPCYLGYCGWTFTSVGPSGGVLYPWVIFWFREFPMWTPVDEWVLERVPHILYPLDQSSGPMISVSGGHGMGLIAALIIGIVLFILAWALSRLIAFRSRTKKTQSVDTHSPR